MAPAAPEILCHARDGLDESSHYGSAIAVMQSSLDVHLRLYAPFSPRACSIARRTKTEAIWRRYQAEPRMSLSASMFSA
jgi:hypothetical protein